MITVKFDHLRTTRTIILRSTMALLLVACSGAVSSLAQNTLTDQEKKDGWRLLFDGKTTDGWRGGGSEAFPAKEWTIKDGVFTVNAEGPGGSGDVITKERFANFELSFEFKTTTTCNSGIKYFVQTDGPRTSLGSVIGLEYQILDDATHPDAKAGRDGNRTIGSLYDLIPAAKTKKTNPIGEWSTGRIVVNGKHVEHWLNGEKTLEYERGSQAYKDAVALSKFNVVPGFGEWADGHILLQDHGDQVSFRTIKIRVLSGK